MLSIHLMEMKGDNYMLNIKKIKLKGFKNIEEIELRLNKVTSLLSINNFGKSNLLNGIDFGIDFITRPENVKKRMMSWKDALPLNKNIKNKDFSFELEFTTTIKKEECDVIYGYSFNWSTDKNKPSKIKNEYLKIKDTQKYTCYVRRNSQNAYYKSSKSGSCQKNIVIGNQELVINKLKSFDSLFYMDIVKIINNINIYIDRHFDPRNSYDINPFIIKSDQDISLLHDNNVPRILEEIKETNPNKYARLINTFKDLFPFVQDIEVKTYKIEAENIKGSPLDGTEPFELSDKLYYLFVKDKNLSQRVSFKLMSDGAKRVLTILTYLTVADINNFPLIAIEEPENSVHPRLLQQYLISLDSFLENSKIIITSHSSHLINYINPNNLYLGIPNEKGLAKFSKIKESAIRRLMNDASELNLLVGEYLFDLMSGTEEDIETLSSYVE